MSKLRKERLQKAEEEIILIEDAGHIVERFTDYHWRIDEKYDVWPSTKKFMKRDGFFKVEKYNKISDIFS